jgi:hypothetical protein
VHARKGRWCRARTRPQCAGACQIVQESPAGLEVINIDLGIVKMPIKAITAFSVSISELAAMWPGSASTADQEPSLPIKTAPLSDLAFFIARSALAGLRR